MNRTAPPAAVDRTALVRLARKPKKLASPCCESSFFLRSPLEYLRLGIAPLNTDTILVGPGGIHPNLPGGSAFMGRCGGVPLNRDHGDVVKLALPLSVSVNGDFDRLQHVL